MSLSLVPSGDRVIALNKLARQAKPLRYKLGRWMITRRPLMDLPSIAVALLPEPKLTIAEMPMNVHSVVGTKVMFYAFRLTPHRWGYFVDESIGETLQKRIRARELRRATRGTTP